jgi:hypothetical protein
MAGPPPRANLPPIWLLVLLGAQLALGLAYAVAELGEMPHYHDTNAYFELARLLRVDAHRGVAYPAFLAGVDRLTGDPSMLRVVANEHPGAACTAPSGIALVQLLQLALCAVALLYWLGTRRATMPGPSALAPGALAVAAGLVMLDPLVAHYALAVMPDALAMAASLVFCGALARLALGARSSVRDGAWLFTAFTAASLLRPEKKWVLLAVAVASLGAWRFGPLRAAKLAAHLPERLPARIALAAGLVGLGLAATLATEQSVHRDYGRPDHGWIILHARVIFPHLGDIQQALPEDVQRRFTPSDVAFYDKHVLNPGPVMERVTAGDRDDAARLTEQMARTAWRERGGAIVADIARDTAENALPTAGFHARWLALEGLGVEAYRTLSRSDMLPWTLKLMTEHHPRLAFASLAGSAVVFTTLAGLAGIGLLRGRARATRVQEGAGDRLAPWVPWVPSIAFALANGAAFALHADAISPRYNLTTHAMLLGGLYAYALSLRHRTR